MQPTDLLASLMQLNGSVAQPQGMPLQAQQDPMTAMAGLGPDTTPAATAPPDLSANINPGKHVQSLEELLFGGL